MKPGRATVPFLLPDSVILVKNVPAEICSSCHEPYMTGKVTDIITDLLSTVRQLKAEVLILAYPDSQSVAAYPAS
jgi:YgiT-type zinc finger domain-containing protein